MNIKPEVLEEVENRMVAAIELGNKLNQRFSLKANMRLYMFLYDRIEKAQFIDDNPFNNVLKSINKSSLPNLRVLHPTPEEEKE